MTNNISLKDLEEFFILNNRIKQLMVSIAPTETNAYDIDATIAYGEKFYSTIIEIEDIIGTIMQIFQVSEQNRKTIEALINSIKKEILVCNYNFNKLETCYRNTISNMEEQLIREIKSTLVGYTMFISVNSLLSQCKTINELLHVFHSYVINNEQILQSIPVKLEKENNKEYPITLRGNPSPLAQQIFENFPIDLNCGYTDIVSLEYQSKVIMMVRDKGHALTIELTEEEGKIWVSYFIPKICNVEMVNKLKGIKKVDNNSSNTVGRFVTDINNLNEDLFTFIKDVPTDMDMVLFEEKNSFKM